jgi:hypothetical protein
MSSSLSTRFGGASIITSTSPVFEVSFTLGCCGHCTKPVS